MATAAEAIIAAEPISAPKAVASAETIMAAAKAVSTTKAITPASTAAKPVTAAIAEIAAGFAGSRCVRRAGIDAVHRHDLKTSRGVLQIADDRRALLQVRCTQWCQCRSVTERVRSIVQSDEPVSLGPVEPLYGALRRSSRKGSRTAIAKVCHAR